MSYTRDHGNIVFECDGKSCHETLDTKTSNWGSALNALHRAWWNATKNPKDDSWTHLCGDCRRGEGLFAHNKSPSEHSGSSA